MATIISNGNTNLNAASGFYRVENANLGAFSSTVLALSSTRTISLTYANTGNAQGAVLALAGAATSDRDVTVKLQENVASVWTDRASKTLTASEIRNSTTSSIGGWIVPFTFTAPYAVTTAGSTWRLEVTQGSGTGNWSLYTSNGTAAFFAVWCDNAVTFANGDTVVCKDEVTVTAAATVTGLLGTGEATRAVSLVLCKSATPPTVDGSESNLQFDTSGGSFTFTVNDNILYGSHSGIQAGSSASPIAAANKLIINWNNSGGTTHGFQSVSSNTVGRASFQFWGAYPSTRVYTLAADANTGASSFVVTDSTGIANGDEFFIGKYAGLTTTTLTFYTVASVAGTTVNITPNIATTNRLAGGKAIKTSGYGIEFTQTTTTGQTWGMGQCSNFVMSGTRQFFSNGATPFLFSAASLAQSGEDSSYRSQWKLQYSVKYAANQQWISLGYTPYEGILIQHAYIFGGMLVMSAWQQQEAWTVDSIQIKNCFMGYTVSAGMTAGTNGLIEWDMQDNTIENFAFGTLQGKNSTFKNNTLRGGSSAGIQMTIQGFYNCTEWSGNTWDSTPTAIRLAGVSVGVTMEDDSGISAGSTYMYSLAAGAYLREFIVKGLDFVPTIDTSEQLQMVEGSRFRFVNIDDVSGEDYNYQHMGDLARTGYGLSDTTAWKSSRTFGVAAAGEYAMRFEPLVGTESMAFEQVIPTGNIQNETMTIKADVKINNAAFYGGTYILPKIEVIYDDGDSTTTATATATTDAQTIIATVTPTTSSGSIRVRYTAATDATGSNAYVYWGKLKINFPSGSSPDFSEVKIWVDALPVTPTITTTVNETDIVQGVWEDTATYSSGTKGDTLQESADNAELASIT